VRSRCDLDNNSLKFRALNKIKSAGKPTAIFPNLGNPIKSAGVFVTAQGQSP